MAKPTTPVILASTSLTSGIVGAWPLNEGSGTIATDVVGGAVLDCSGSGVSWSSSPLGLLTVGSPSVAQVATPSYLKLYPSTQPALTIIWVGSVLGSLGTVSIGGVSFGYDFYTVSTKFGYACGGGAQDGSSGYTPGTTYQVMLQQASGVLTGFMNGTANGSKSNNLTGGIAYGGTSHVYLGNSSGTENYRHDLLVIWNRAITAPEITAMVSDPWQIFVVPPSAATSTVTEAHDTQVAPAVFTSPAALTKTEAHDTLAGLSADTFAAALARTEAHDSLAGLGAVPSPGSFLATERHDSLVAAGVYGIPGILARTEAHDTLAAAGANAFAAALAATEHHDVLRTTPLFPPARRPRGACRWHPALNRHRARLTR